MEPAADLRHSFPSALHCEAIHALGLFMQEPLQVLDDLPSCLLLLEHFGLLLKHGTIIISEVYSNFLLSR
jgi:hypothetical protein